MSDFEHEFTDHAPCTTYKLKNMREVNMITSQHFEFNMGGYGR